MARQRSTSSARRRSSTKELVDDTTERKSPAKIPSRRDAETFGTSRVLPVQLHIGDRIADETGEWEVTGRPFTTVGGKHANVRIRLIKQPTVTEIRVWGAYERVSVKRAASAEESKG